MALVNLPSVKDAKSLEQVIDAVEKMRKEVEFLLNNVENDNIRGQIEASKIVIGGGTTYEEGYKPVDQVDINQQILLNYKKQLEVTKSQIDAKFNLSYNPVPSLKVATWNTHGGRNQAGTFIDLSTDPRLLLAAGGYEIVGLQEVLVNYSQSISKYPLAAYCKYSTFYAGGFFKAETYPGEATADFGLGLLQKKYGIANPTKWVMPNTAGAEPRLLTRSEITVNGNKIYIFNAHTRYDDDNIRRSQLAFIKTKLDELNGASCICFGDFNVRSVSEYDVFSTDYNCINGVGGYYYDTYNLSDWDTRKIDNIIYSKDMTVTARGVTNTTLSDHSILWGTLTVPDAMKTKKDAFDDKYDALIAAIDSATADGKTTNEEKADIDLKIAAYKTAITALGISFDLVIREISSVDAQQFANNLFEVVQGDIQQVQDNLNSFSNYVEGAFYDGVVSESESKAIGTYINTLNNEKADVDNRFTQISTNANLPASPKAALILKKDAYNTAHTNLINAINDTIADSKATIEERTNVDLKFNLYRNALADLSTQFEKAIDAIAAELARLAQQGSNGYTDGKDTALRGDMRLIAPLPTSLTLDANGITATNSLDANKYARLDYRGLYVKQGAIAIERPDGYLVMNDGTATFDFGIDAAEPPFREVSTINVSGIWYKFTNFNYAAINYYNYKHTGKFLKVTLALKADAGTTAWVRIVADAGGTELWKTSTTDTSLYGTTVTATVPLGTPTGNTGQFYIQCGTSDDTNTKAGYVRVLRKWLEG